MTNAMKINKMRIDFYNSILRFFNEKKLVEVEFFTPVTFEIDEGVTSNLVVSVDVKSINKDGDMVANYLNQQYEDDTETLIRLTELNVNQIATILDELERGRYEILQEAE